MRFLATPPIDGAFTQYLAIRADFTHPIPDEMSDEEAALLEPLSVGLWAGQRAQLSGGDRVLVSGAGPVGLLAAEAARAQGAGEVLVTDVNPHRLDLAAEHGFRARNVSADPLPDSPEFDVLIECSGAPGALAAGVAALAAGGRAVMVGVPGSSDVALPLPALHDREISVATIFRYANTWPTAISLVGSERVRLDGLVTHRFGLAEAAAALTAASADARVVKAMVCPQE
jgi:L-iditol 2-dehydrogenase